MSLKSTSNQCLESQLDELERRLANVNTVHLESVEKLNGNLNSLKRTLEDWPLLDRIEQNLNVQREMTLKILNELREGLLERVKEGDEKQMREIFEKEKSVLSSNLKSKQSVRIPAPIRLVRLNDLTVYQKLKYVHLFDPSRTQSNQIDLKEAFDDLRKHSVFLLNSDRLVVHSKFDNVLYVFDHRVKMVLYEKSIPKKYRILSLRCFNNRIVCLKQSISKSYEVILSIYDEYLNLVKRKHFENELVHSLPCISSKLIGYWSVSNKRYELLNYDLELVDCFGMIDWQKEHLNDGPLIHVNEDFFFIQNLNKSLQIKCINRHDLRVVRSIPIDSSISFLVQIDSESRLFVKYNHSNADSSSLVCVDARTGNVLFEQSLLTDYLSFYLCDDHLAYSNLNRFSPNLFICFPYI